MSVFPVNRVPDILKRMDLNSSQAEAMKTCFGILAIMSREDSNKLLIAKDGMEIILNAMTVHVDRTDVQESGCDLLWSLAFNSSAVKDIIAKYGGSVVLVRALKRHSRSADFLKSACGALSNMCQSKLNQEGVSSQGGLQPLVGSIHVHQTNAKLLPFIFDAIASIIVNNEDNARTVSSLGIVPVVVASLSRHKAGMEVVKSGCHTLAILSDVKGQASKIAFAGGVPIILSLLDTHPLYSDLHRVAAVVLLRMLQESAHVGREITCHEGVRILLNSLEKGGAQQDTVAAVTHILYTVTNPSNPSASSIEAQLWLPAPPTGTGASATTTTTSGSNNAVVTTTSGNNEHASPSAKRKNSLHSITSDPSVNNNNTNNSNLTSLLIANSTSAAVAAGLLGPGSGVGPQGCTALTGVVLILGQYASRRDVVRAACRLINNLSGYTNVVTALDRLGILDKIFECAAIHRDTKDVLDSATSLIKTIHRRAIPTLQNPTPGSIQGLLHVFKVKLSDEECSTACIEAMTRLVENTCKSVTSADKRKELDDQRLVEGKLWEHAALVIILGILQSVTDGDRDEAGKNNPASGAQLPSSSSTSAKSTTASTSVWGKHSTKVISSALSFIETLYHANKLHVDMVLFKDTWDMLHSLLRGLTTKSADLTRRVERLIGMIDITKQDKSPYNTLGSRKSLISLKPPLPNNGNDSDGFMFNGVNMRKLSYSEDNLHGTNPNNTTLHSRDNSSGNNSLAGVSGNNNNNNGGGGPSPLAMGRKVKEYTGSEASLYGEPLDESNNNIATSNINKRGFGKSKSCGTSLNSLSNAQQQDDNASLTGTGGALASSSTEVVVTSTSTSPRKTLPMHPCKVTLTTSSQQQQQQQSLAQRRMPGGSFNTNTNNNSSGGNSGGRYTNSSSPAPTPAPRLLDTWPNFLERLSVSSSGSMNRAYLNTNQDSSTPNRMQLSYESSSAAGRGLMSKCPTPVPYFVPPNGLGEPFDHSLTFDSDFESGNLLRAVQKGESNYDLFLRSDLHTPGHTQWFYFAVANTHSPELVKLHEQGVDVPPVRVRFNIVNFTKPDSLFNLGMRPVVYSVSDANTKNIGWVRSGSDISYYGNSFLRNNSAGEGLLYYYTLSFTLEFSNINDTVLIAYSYPYTMSDYRSHLGEILDRPGSSDVIRQFRLCQTISGEDCDLLVVTNFQDSRERIGPVNLQMLDGNGGDASNNNNNTGAFGGGGGSNSNNNANTSGIISTKTSRLSKRNSSNGNNNSTYKPALFLSCRVHPGETPASWMMKGMLEFLTSDCPQAQLLRQVFVIFIVPMLNPDGVIYGNNRCNLSGVDLNRQWKLPIKALHPTIFHLKYFMQAQRKLRDVCMYIDLHGHSRKYNVFMYGCDDKKKPRPQVRTFPKMLSMHSAGRKYVCYNDCSFAVKKGRESTARVVVSKEINILNSFTLEATFCGSNYGPLKHCHMNIGHLQEVGSSLCDSILNYFISEGVVKDTMTVPHNVKAVLAFEKIIASEGLGSTNEYSTAYSASGSGGFTSGMYTSTTTNTAGISNPTGGINEGRERSGSNGTEASSSTKMTDPHRSGEKSGISYGGEGNGSEKSATAAALSHSRRLAASAAAAADLALSNTDIGGSGIADNETGDFASSASAPAAHNTSNTIMDHSSTRNSSARRSPVPSTSSREIGNDGGDAGNGDDGNIDSEMDNNNETEELGSGSDGSDADGSDTESLAPSTMYNTNSLGVNNANSNSSNSSGGGLYANSQNSHSVNSNLNNLSSNSNTASKTRIETLSAEGGRMRMNSLPMSMHHSSNTMLNLGNVHTNNTSSYHNASSSNNVLAITTPGLSRVLAASGRNSILSSTSNVEKINTINSMRALTTPNVRNTSSGSNNTSTSGSLVHSYAGSLTGRGAGINSTSMNTSVDGDSDFHSISSSMSGVNDGIASLQLSGIGAGAGVGAHGSDNEALFSKTKKGKKKKQSGTNSGAASAKDKKSATSSGGRPSKKLIKDGLSMSQTMNSPTVNNASSMQESDDYEIYDSTSTGLNFGSTSQSASNKAGGVSGAGNTIVKAEYQDILLQPIDNAAGYSNSEDSGNSLAKAQAVATPFGLPKLK